jgi:hypothetical protein
LEDALMRDLNQGNVISGPKQELPPGIEIAYSPLNMSAASFRDKSMRPSGPHRLVIGPSRGFQLFSYGFAIVGGGALILGVLALGGEENPAIVFVVGGIFLAAGLLMVAASRRFVFDREEGTLHIRSHIRADSRPLSGIVAVQVSEGGYHSMSNGGCYTTYQLNLVVEGEDRRIGLSNHSDRDWTAEAGVGLAEFLGVPLLSRVAVRDAREKARVAARERRLHRRIAMAVAGASVVFVGGFVAVAALALHLDVKFDTLAWVVPLGFLGSLALGVALGICLYLRLGLRHAGDR